MVRPFYEGKNILEILLQRFGKSDLKDQVAVLTSTAPGDDEIERIAVKEGVKCFRGSEEDVLQRFVDAGEFFKVHGIIRVCADNPFLDIQSIRYLIEHASAGDDYFSFKMRNERPVILNHIGLFAEYVPLKTLKYVAAHVKEPIYREHVTNFIHGHPDQFQVHLEYAPDLSGEIDIRLTCDTEEDFTMLQEMYEQLNPYIETPVELIGRIRQNAVWMQIMKGQIEKHGK